VRGKRLKKYKSFGSKTFFVLGKTKTIEILRFNSAKLNRPDVENRKFYHATLTGLGNCCLLVFL
jgi:hypothetical protein